MTRIEELLRDSLRARAGDVEPTPALWHEVDRRIARRRRRQVLTWSLAGAGAVAAAVLVVPAVLGIGGGPQVPQIEPLEVAPAPTADVPTHVLVLDEAGAASVLELDTGEATSVSGEGQGLPLDLAVGAGSTPTRVDYAAALEGPDRSVYVVNDQRAVSVFGEDSMGPGLRPSVAGSADGRHLAHLLPTDDGAVLVVRPFRSEVDAAESSEVAVLEGGTRLLDWVGPSDEIGAQSLLWAQRPDGAVVAHDLVRVEDGFELAATSPALGGDPAVLDLATSGAGGGEVGEPLYVLRRGTDGPEVVWSADGGATDTVVRGLGDLLDDADPQRVWLDASHDAALVGDGDRAWIVLREDAAAGDGAAALGEPVELGAGIARAGLLPPQGRAAPDAAPPDGPDAEPGDPEATVPDPAVGPLPAPVVLADGRELRRVGPDGTTTLVELPEEGGSTFLAAGVRPGSTPDDLTVVSLTTAEGMEDLRWTRVVDGEVTVAHDAFEGAYAPSAGAAVGRPVWSPDGTSLAWLERDPDGDRLRTIGWDDGPGTGDPATDNAAFGLELPEDGELHLQEWAVSASPASGMTELRAAREPATAGWYAIPLERQADGAWARPATVPVEGFTAEPGPAGVGDTLALAGTTDDGRLRWMVRRTDDGVVLVAEPYGAAVATDLPDELLAGNRPPTRALLPQVWVRDLGAGAVVGTPYAASAWYVPVDGEPVRLPGGVSDADVVG